MHKYLRHLGDYAKDTKHLSMLEHGAYNQMLDWCYASEKPLPTDEKALFRLCSAFEKAEQQAVRSVRDEFFIQTASGYTQKRVLEEITEYQDKAAKAREAAGKRWHGNGNADAMQTHSGGNANGMPRARVPLTDNQVTILLSAPEGAGPQGAGSATVPAEPAPPKKKKGGAASEEEAGALQWSAEAGWQGVDDVLRDELARAYPACDIRRQFLVMEQWLKSNPVKAHKSNWRRFVTNWLQREQDRGGDLRGQPAPPWSGMAQAAQVAAVPARVIEEAPDGLEQALRALWGDDWQKVCPSWPQMLASDKAQVRKWLAENFNDKVSNSHPDKTL